MFHVTLRVMCILLLLDDINYIQFVDGTAELNYVLTGLDVSISDIGMLQFPTVIVDSSISHCRFL